MLKIIPLDKIREFITTVDMEDSSELEASIKELGVLSPISVREMGDEDYLIINGRLRVLAARRLGLTEIPAHVFSITDVEAAQVNIMTSVQRVQTTQADLGNTIAKLIEAGHSWGKLAEKLRMPVRKLKHLYEQRSKR